MVRKSTGKETSASKKPRVSSKPSTRVRACKDCGSTSRALPHPGPRCATCHRIRRNALSVARRLAYVAKQYNLTPEQYQALREACPKNAKGEPLCPICEKRRASQVDHDHKCCKGKTSCGKCVRGLLCGPCNKFLGLIGDRTKALLNGVDYLDKYNKKDDPYICRCCGIQWHCKCTCL